MRAPLPKVFITCAVTGNLTTPEQTPHLPITPEQIAESALAAAEAGAAIVHLHVRDPETGRPSMELDLYREVVERIRARNPQLIINLTTGPGRPLRALARTIRRSPAPGTTLMAPEQRVEHIAALQPDICTLDLNTMNSGGEVVINTPGNVRRMAKVIAEAGVEARDRAVRFRRHRAAARPAQGRHAERAGADLLRHGRALRLPAVAGDRALCPRPAAARTPLFTAIGIGRASFQSVALSYLAGGHVRVGLEDAVYLDRGVLAPSNAAMVEKARRIVEDLGGQIASPARSPRHASACPTASPMPSASPDQPPNGVAHVSAAVNARARFRSPPRPAPARRRRRAMRRSSSASRSIRCVSAAGTTRSSSRSTPRQSTRPTSRPRSA